MSPDLVRHSLTPLKTPGKRNCDPSFKYNKGRRRHPALRKHHESSSVTRPAWCHKRSRKRAPLETLPTEMIQYIFRLSANLELPSVSPDLASKLCNSRHLYISLTDESLRPIISPRPGCNADSRHLINASRLLSCKFVTWSFFRQWLLNGRVFAEPTNLEAWKDLWRSLCPAPGLLPPAKLFSPPLSADKSDFLSLLTSEHKIDFEMCDPVYMDHAHEGLRLAVESSDDRAVCSFLSSGLNADTELLRTAVVDNNCASWTVVKMLLAHGIECSDGPSRSASRSVASIDYYDPVIWNWVEKSRNRGNHQGEHLMELMRECLLPSRDSRPS